MAIRFTGEKGSSWEKGGYDFDVIPYENSEAEGPVSLTYSTARIALWESSAPGRQTRALHEIRDTAAGDYVGNYITRANALALLDDLAGKASIEKAGETIIPGIYIFRGDYGFVALLHDSEESSPEVKVLLEEYARQIDEYPSFNDDYTTKVEFQMLENHIDSCFSRQQKERLEAIMKLRPGSTLGGILDDLGVKHNTESTGLIYYVDEKAMDMAVAEVLKRAHRLDREGEVVYTTSMAKVVGDNGESQIFSTDELGFSQGEHTIRDWLKALAANGYTIAGISTIDGEDVAHECARLRSGPRVSRQRGEGRGD